MRMAKILFNLKGVKMHLHKTTAIWGRSICIDDERGRNVYP
jgi:hypothetical protein